MHHHHVIATALLCACIAPANAQTAGARPGDTALTCDQIRAELAPMAQQARSSGVPADIARDEQARRAAMQRQAAEQSAQDARQSAEAAKEAAADAALDAATMGMGSGLKRLFGGGEAKERAQAQAEEQRAKRAWEESQAQEAKMNQQVQRMQGVVDVERAARLGELAEAKKCKPQ